MTAVDTSSLSALKYLTASENIIEAIDLSANSKLRSADLDHNFLTALDVSKNAELKTLNASSNFISSINTGSNNIISGSISSNYIYMPAKDNKIAVSDLTAGGRDLKTSEKVTDGIVELSDSTRYFNCSFR